ncbi:hypothetical protein GCM10009535_59710 [Streptomyces thermocarboxydovorans]|uniref:Transposase n=1 Tax=Streptomyces thermocarboxydovorans TaxID=59298 RepID=A0ABN1HXH3_9ACTN
MCHLLPDGSYLTTVCAGKYKAGRGYGRLEVRIVEARMTVTLADGTRRSELWRLMTSLRNAERYPARELIALYHRRWQAETCYFSLKSTILDGRVLRSRPVPGIEQEVLRTARRLPGTGPRRRRRRHRTAGSASAECEPDRAVQRRRRPDRGSSRDHPDGPGGPDRSYRPCRPGRPSAAGAALAREGRVRKRNSKYTFTTGKHPRSSQAYVLDFEILKDGGLDSANTG